MPAYFPVEDTYLNIARGLVKGVFGVHKQGALPSLSQNQTGTVWAYDATVYPWSAWDAGANNLTITCSTNDLNKYLLIDGLDSDYNILREDILLSNTTTVSSNTFSRINFAIVHDDGSINNDDVVIAVNSVNVAKIIADTGQALAGVYTVPKGYTAYITKGAMSCQAGADGTGNMYVRYKGGFFGEELVNGFMIAHTFEVSGTGGEYMYEFSVPQAVPEKSDIDVRVTTRTNNGRFTCAWDMVLVKTGLE